MIEIDGKICEAGQKLQVLFKPYDMPIELPATIICGKNPGMNLLITTQIHSGEYNGSAAVMRLADILTPEKLENAINSLGMIALLIIMFLILFKDLGGLG